MQRQALEQPAGDFAFGLRAQRPSAGGPAGQRYYETDTDWLYLWDGVRWWGALGLFVSADADRLALTVTATDAGALALSESGGVYRLWRVNGSGAWVELPLATSLTVEESDEDPTETPVSKIIVCTRVALRKKRRSIDRPHLVDSVDAPGTTRTCDLLIRSLKLIVLPIWLGAEECVFIGHSHSVIMRVFGLDLLSLGELAHYRHTTNATRFFRGQALQ